MRSYRIAVFKLSDWENRKGRENIKKKMPEHIMELNENMKPPIQKKEWPNKISLERGNVKRKISKENQKEKKKKSKYYMFPERKYKQTEIY